MLVLVFVHLVACAALAPAPAPRFTRRHAVALSAPLLASPPLVRAAGPATPGFAAQPGLRLNTGTNFPIASFGLQVYDDATAEKLTAVALEKGFRNFFASVLAGNQRGFARAVQRSGVPRSELYICGSVLSNRANGYDAAYKATQRGCRENMEAFAAGGIDYLDQIMLDYPGPDADSIRGQWQAFEEMQASRLTRSISVSNFSPAQLDALLGGSAKPTVPAVNQLPYGVGFGAYYGGNAAAVVAENTKRGIAVQAWSPLRKALSGSARAACAEIGARYGKSAAQVGLRYIADTGCCYTTQSKTSAHFAEDLDIFDFKLTKEEVATLAAL